jgi:methylmalonyl-CoA mutase N-terminal domain/subunit
VELYTASRPSVTTTEETRETDSGIPLRPYYTVADELDAGRPGSFPFTRGLHEEGYRRKLWTMRQYSGFGTAAQTNERFHYLLRAGQTGLSTAFDLPTQMGLDSGSSARARRSWSRGRRNR